MRSAVNERIVMNARTPKGAWTAKQLAAWGVPWPPPKGWKKKLINGPRLKGNDAARPVYGPSQAKTPFVATINGRQVAVEGEPGNYVFVRR